MQTLKTRTIAVLGAVFAGTVSLAGIAHADLPRMRVSYADLDTASQQGRTTLARRIDHAAHSVCDLDGYNRTAISACHDTVVDRAYADLQQRGVTGR